jgi:hypothetical protein
MSVMIQYLGFQLKPRGRDYSYRVVDPKAETREFTLTISNQAFMERRVPYQDAPGLCYQKLQRDLTTETPERPLRQHFTVSDQELAEFRERYHPVKRHR